MNTQKATLKALLNDVITELMVKTTGDQVYLNETTTASAKIAELVSAVNDRAKTADVTAAIDELRQELLGDTPVEAYNTFTELAEYIEAHKDVSDALTAAIGNKADADEVLLLSGGNMTPDARIEITKSQNDDAGYGVSDGATFAMMTSAGIDVGEVGSDNVDSTTQIRYDYIKANTFIGNLEGTVDSATKAIQLAEAKTIKTNLASTTAAEFDGTSNITPGVSGILPIANGGTGASTAEGALSKLGLTATATELNYMDGVTSGVQDQLDSKTAVYISATQPAGLTSSDLWFDIS